MSAGSILVVDYHQDIARVMKAALTRAAFDVLTAGTGEEALGILGAAPHVDLVLSEVLMPSGISGPDLVRTMQQSFPSTAAMLMTGFTEQRLDPAIPLLRKPFAPATLVACVQQVLAGARWQAEELQRSFNTLQSAFEETLDLQRELQSAIWQARCLRRQSRRQRAEWLRTRLRERNAVIPTVIVAEDDPASRYAVCRFLSRSGLRVLEACSGEEALKVMREYNGRIDMLVTDFRLPKMDGLEVAKNLRTERPDTGVVFMSGEEIDVPYPAIRKPFDPDDLLALIAEQLLLRKPTARRQ